jgi:hypothetical protein
LRDTNIDFFRGFRMNKRCPDEEKLLDYLAGRLAEDDRFEVEEHLSDCQTCLDALILTTRMVRDEDQLELDPVPAEVTESAVQLVTRQCSKSYGALMEKVERFVKDTFSKIWDSLQLGPWARWQPVPIRGSKKVTSDDLVCLRVPFKDIDTEIEIEKTGGNKARIRVKLHEASKHKEGVRVTLKAGEREIASYLFEDGSVLFEDIPFGHYSISLAKDGLESGTYFFEIKETLHGRR